MTTSHGQVLMTALLNKPNSSSPRELVFNSPMPFGFNPFAPCGVPSVHNKPNPPSAQMDVDGHQL